MQCIDDATYDIYWFAYTLNNSKFANTLSTFRYYPFALVLVPYKCYEVFSNYFCSFSNFNLVVCWRVGRYVRLVMNENMIRFLFTLPVIGCSQFRLMAFTNN